MHLSGDENTFTKILTTAPNNKITGRGQPSWFEKRKRSLSFSGDGMIQCPSCRGSGVRDVSTDLVALIPYSDERLKPRHTKCKISLALLLCSIIIGTMTYIFLPGKVIVTTTNMTIVSASIVDNTALTSDLGIYMTAAKPVNKSKITWLVGVNVINENRILPITVNELKLNLTWNALDEVNVGYHVLGNFTIKGHETYDSSLLVETPQDDVSYNDLLLTCKCCRQYTHGPGCKYIHMFSSISLRYTLHIGQFNYFSGFASSRTPGFDNCNYFENMKSKNITCQTYEKCGIGADLETYF
ncbi:hypothetical protein ACHWQZ_G006036 [Mnemiopsis leidyi]